MITGSVFSKMESGYEEEQQIINDMDCWKRQVFIWVNGNTAEVNLGISADIFPGFKEG